MKIIPTKKNKNPGLYNILKEFSQYISSQLHTTNAPSIKSIALHIASTVHRGLSLLVSSKFCKAYFTGTQLYLSQNFSLNGNSVILPTINIISENPDFNACDIEYSIKVDPLGQTLANCFIFQPKREDIHATI